MIQSTPSRVSGLARVALLLVLLAVAMVAGPSAAWATHIRAGDIQVKPDTTLPRENRVPRRMFFKLILYTDNSSSVLADFATVFFGDGTSSCKDGVPRLGGRRAIPGNTDTSVNVYYFEHTYPSAGEFTVSYIGENRNDALNIDRPLAQTFYISTTFTLDPAL